MWDEIELNRWDRNNCKRYLGAIPWKLESIVYCELWTFPFAFAFAGHSSWVSSASEILALRGYLCKTGQMENWRPGAKAAQLLRLKRLKSHFHMPYMCFTLGSNIYYTNRWRSVCDFVLLANLHTSMPNVGFVCRVSSVVFRRVCALYLTNC